MIRFVHIGDQIDEGKNSFAFFDTVTSSFWSFAGAQVFDSKEDFELFAKDDPFYKRGLELIAEPIEDYKTRAERAEAALAVAVRALEEARAVIHDEFCLVVSYDSDKCNDACKAIGEALEKIHDPR